MPDDPKKHRYTYEEIRHGALVNLSHEERWHAAMNYGQLDSRGEGCVAWLLILVSVLVGYIWSNWWYTGAYAIGALVVIGLHYGFKTFAVITLHRRPRWFAFNGAMTLLTKMLFILGTLGILGSGIWVRWLA